MNSSTEFDSTVCVSKDFSCEEETGLRLGMKLVEKFDQKKFSAEKEVCQKSNYFGGMC